MEAVEGENYREKVNRQRMEALAKGNSVRFRRADLKRGIASGEIDIIDLLEGHLPEWDAALKSTPIHHLLTSIRRVGPGTAHDVEADLGVSGTLRVGDLSTKQRRELGRTVRMLLGRDDLA
jgi:hypothetical protein